MASPPKAGGVVAKAKKVQEVWFWELCQECKEHGRFVRESRDDFTFECGSFGSALDMLDAIKERINDAQRVEGLYQEIRRTPLPQEDAGILPELRGLLDNWNKSHDKELDSPAPPLDPVEFHKFAGHLVVTSQETKH